MTDDEILKAYMRPYGEEARKLIRQVERLRIMGLAGQPSASTRNSQEGRKND